MNKRFFVFIIVIMAIAAGAYYFYAHRHAQVLKSAKQCETAGDLQQALSLYCAVLVDDVPSIDIPNINRSKYLAHDILKKDVMKYMTWITTPSTKVASNVAAAFAGMVRNESRGRQDNTISEPVIRPLTPDQYLAQWNTTFFAPHVKVDPAHAALASGNYFRKVSLLVINSPRDYTYEIELINTSTHRGIKCTLLPDNAARLYALPGEHLLLCRSSVVFASGELWRSDYTPLRLVIPPEPSLVTTDLRTSIQRGMRQAPAIPK